MLVHIKASWAETKSIVEYASSSFRLNIFGKLVMLLPFIIMLLIGFVLEVGMDHSEGGAQ